MEEKYEDGVCVISVSGEEAFAAKCHIEEFAAWYDENYEMTGCTREQFIDECEVVFIDQDGFFIDAAELNLNIVDIREYKKQHLCAEFVDWNNRKFGQWIEEFGKVKIFATYRQILKAAMERGETYEEPVMLMSMYA